MAEQRCSRETTRIEHLWSSDQTFTAPLVKHYNLFTRRGENLPASVFVFEISQLLLKNYFEKYKKSVNDD